MAHTFTHKLGCALRMVDATTGRALESGVRLFRAGQEIFPARKAGGFFLFMGAAADFEVDIRAEGFEPLTETLRFEPEDAAPPVRDLQLIPKPDEHSEDAFFTLAGAASGLDAIDAVRMGDNACFARSYEKRRGVLTVFNPHRLNLDMVFYAIVDPSENSYEAIEITRRITGEAFHIAPAPQKEIAAHFLLCRRVIGRVRQDGHYLLRLRRSVGRRWIVRTVTAGREQFEVVDIQPAQPDGRRLEPP